MWIFSLMSLAATIPSGWPMFRYDQAQTGFSPAPTNFSTKPEAKAEWLVWDEYDLVYSSPVGADFNGDGWHDVVIGSYGGSSGDFPLADVYRGDNGVMIWASSVNASRGCYYGGPALMDITGDGTPEVFVPCVDSGELFALNGATGSPLWKAFIDSDEFSSPLVTEEGATGRVYVCSSMGTLYCLRATTGAVLWEHPDDSGDLIGPNCYSSPSKGDVNGDGQDEIVYTSSKMMYVISTGGSERWRVSVGSNDKLLSTVALADRDGDGAREMWVYCAESGRLKVYRYGNSTPVINVSVGAVASILKWPPPPAVADVNLDGVPDAVLHHHDGVTMVDGASGSIAWNTSAQDLYGPVTLANLDLDPALEIIAVGKPPVGNRCKVEMYQENGSLAWQWWSPSPNNDEVPGEAILINVDADAAYEIAAVDYSCWVVVLDASGSLYEDVEEGLGKGFDFRATGQNIYLFMPNQTQVSLTLYDAQGRLVQKLYDGVLTSGDHTFSPKLEANGVYMVLLRYKEGMKSLKIVR